MKIFILCFVHRLAVPDILDKIKNNGWRIWDANFLFLSCKRIFTDTCTCSMFLDTKSSKTRYTEYFFNINSINNNPRLFNFINNSEAQRKWERHSRWLRTLSLIRYFCRMNWSMNSFCSASTLDKASYSIRYLEYTDTVPYFSTQRQNSLIDGRHVTSKRL